MMTYGFLVVGCGSISSAHIDAITALPSAELKAVMDVAETRAKVAGETAGVRWFTDLDEALDAPGVDVVSVCVPSGRHAQVGVRAAQARKHVVVEKPIDITLSAADRLIEACDRAGVGLTVISQYRFEPGVRRLRALIDQGRLGQLVLGNATMRLYRSQGYYDSADWRGTWALDGGGALMNQGVHYLDLLRWMMGPLEAISARCVTRAHRRIEVEDIALATVAFRSGAVGTIQASTAVYPGLTERLEVTGLDGTVVIDSNDVVLCELRDERGEPDDYGETLSERRDLAAGPGDSAPVLTGHTAQIDNFLSSLDQGTDPFVTGMDGRDALEVVLATYESSRQGREVRLPLAAGEQR